jgi:uncharacterized protein YprB with RNaseH-like and TPR domain
LLRRTFAHIPNIGEIREQELWADNIQTWDDYLVNYDRITIPNKESIQEHILKSIEAYNTKNYDFFINSIPQNLHWRLYNEFKDKCCFLDIETTGLDKYSNSITVIGLYNGKDSKFFIKDINLQEFPEEIKKYDMIITFNGKRFDLPFIKSKFPEVNLNKFHIDLLYPMRTLGYSGGLKHIEKELGLNREQEIKEVNGWEAVRLWYRYKKGDKQALATLLKYNKADIENLKTLMEFTFTKLADKTPIFATNNA